MAARSFEALTGRAHGHISCPSALVSQLQAADSSTTYSSSRGLGEWSVGNLVGLFPVRPFDKTSDSYFSPDDAVLWEQVQAADYKTSMSVSSVLAALDQQAVKDVKVAFGINILGVAQVNITGIGLSDALDRLRNRASVVCNLYYTTTARGRFSKWMSKEMDNFDHPVRYGEKDSTAGFNARSLFRSLLEELLNGNWTNNRLFRDCVLIYELRGSVRDNLQEGTLYVYKWVEVGPSALFAHAHGEGARNVSESPPMLTLALMAESQGFPYVVAKEVIQKAQLTAGLAVDVAEVPGNPNLVQSDVEVWSNHGAWTDVTAKKYVLTGPESKTSFALFSRCSGHERCRSAVHVPPTAISGKHL